MEITERQGNKQDFECAKSYNRLAMNYMQMEEYDEAVKYFRQYLQIAELLKGMPARVVSDF